MKTTVVIPNYNGKHFLQDCLDSLLQSTVEIAVIVVDNGSTDGSVSWIQEHFPQVKLICFSENKGFCTAVNTGIEAAATPYVFLLNNDTKTDRFCLECLERAMDADEKIFSVGAKMLSMKEPELVDTAGDLYSAFGWAYAIGKGRPSSNYTAPKRVFSNCAGAALYRKAHLEQIGGFDELHFAYLEDVDIGYRAQIFGLKNVTEPAAVVYHAGSGSTGSRYNAFKVTHSSRNNIYLIYKNMPVLQILLNLPAFILGFSAKLVFFASKGYGKEYLAGIKNGFFICRKPENRAKKIRFEWKRLGTYFVIEWELFINVFRRFLERA